MSDRLDRINAFEKTFRDYYAPLCNYANKYINDWDAAQDIVQTTFLKLWNKWDALQSASSQKSYLFTAVKNTLLDQFKKEERKAKREEVYNELIRDSESSLDNYIIKSEIMKSLDKVKPKVRKIFILNKMEGLTYAEIAQYLKISQRSVEDNMSKALKSLRKDLAGNELLMK